MESNDYKNLGNAIRQAVFSKKDAPTMLPDNTVEKLGLSDDDVLNVEEETPLDTEEALEQEIAHLQSLLQAKKDQ